MMNCLLNYTVEHNLSQTGWDQRVPDNWYEVLSVFGSLWQTLSSSWQPHKIFSRQGV